MVRVGVVIEVRFKEYFTVISTPDTKIDVKIRFVLVLKTVDIKRQRYLDCEGNVNSCEENSQ